MERFSLDWWTILLGGLSTLAIFSFLYRENPVYRFFEHFYIGIATGISTIASIKFFIWPQVFKPLLGYDLVPLPDGTFTAPYNKLQLLLIIPMAFGLLYYFILSKRHNWIAQIVIGFSLGIGGGMAFKATFNALFPQLVDSFRPLFIPGDISQSFSNIIFSLTLISAFSYFFFTFKRTRGGLVERSANLGRWLMMGCFGAFFGATIMARMALLVERLSFLINDWVKIFIS